MEYIAGLKQERRDDRKRKIEDRKRQREEDKQRKRNQVAKAIPKSIAEDAKVRTQLLPEKIIHIFSHIP